MQRQGFSLIDQKLTKLQPSENGLNLRFSCHRGYVPCGVHFSIKESCKSFYSFIYAIHMVCRCATSKFQFD